MAERVLEGNRLQQVFQTFVPAAHRKLIRTTVVLPERPQCGIPLFHTNSLVAIESRSPADFRAVTSMSAEIAEAAGWAALFRRNGPIRIQ